MDSCTCFHWSSSHVNGSGRCREKDSYALPCQCPGFEHDTNTDEHPDDDWSESEPDQSQSTTMVVASLRRRAEA